MSKMLSKMNLISVVQQLPDEDIELVQNYVEMIERENEELKKQLEERSKDYCNASNIKYNYAKKLVIIQNQQQEFIKYLENCIKELEKESLNKLQNVLNLGICDITKEILKKYKKIIGDEVNDKK